MRIKWNPPVMCFEVAVFLNIHSLLNMELSRTERTGSLGYLPLLWDSKFCAKAAGMIGRTSFMQNQFTLSKNWDH